MTIASTKAWRLRATSAMVSRSPQPTLPEVSWMAEPPSWTIPASNVTRVRSDGRSNSIASVRRTSGGRSCRRWAANSSLQARGGREDAPNLGRSQVSGADEVAAAQTAGRRHGRGAPWHGFPFAISAWCTAAPCELASGRTSCVPSSADRGSGSRLGGARAGGPPGPARAARGRCRGGWHRPGR